MSIEINGAPSALRVPKKGTPITYSFYFKVREKLKRFLGLGDEITWLYVGHFEQKILIQLVRSNQIVEQVSITWATAEIIRDLLNKEITLLKPPTAIEGTITECEHLAPPPSRL